MINEKDVIDMYVNKDCSTYVIATKYSTYPNKIRRILLKNGIELDSKSTAQKKALGVGRSTHPTKGKKRSKQTKEKISESVYEYWKKMSEQEKIKRSLQAQEQWNNMTTEEQENLRKSAAEAVRKASKEGSKMEQFLLDNLTSMGYNILFHQSGLIANEDMEIDLFIPELRTAIEIDGPSHFFPIWGETEEEKQIILQKHIKSDAHKSGLLLSNDFVVIRVKHLTKSLSEKHKRDVLAEIVKLLKQIENQFPPKEKRYIELEVN